MCQHSEALWRSLLLRFRQLMVGWDASHPAGCRVASGMQGSRRDAGPQSRQIASLPSRQLRCCGQLFGSVLLQN